MRKKLTSMVFVIMFLLVTYCPIVTPKIKAEASSVIKIGDYVQLGKYYNEPILWRCVAIDENGPLMLSDKILSIKPFDAAGSHPSDYGDYRLNYGSNLWETSNMRSWLNSTATAGNVNWSCGNAPTSNKVFGGYNAYANEAGFLSDHNFTASERSVIKTVTQKSILDYQDSALKASGSEILVYDSNISTIVQNYDRVYSKQVTDKMFLLDVKQVNKIYQNRSVLGSNYYEGRLSQKAMDNDNNPNNKQYYNIGCWSYWLRTPMCYIDNDFGFKNVGHCTMYVKQNAGYAWNGSGCESPGIRPAFYLNQSSAAFKSGNGMLGSPYVLDVNSKPIENGGLEEFNYYPNEFNKTLAIRAAEFSMLAYDDYRWISYTDEIYYTKEKRDIVPVPIYLNKKLQMQKFENIYISPTYGDSDAQNVSFVIAEKDVMYHDEKLKLTTVIIRGTDSEEWRGNMDVTGLLYDESETNHSSWDYAKGIVLNELETYLEKNSIQKSLVLITGHSRGAAVANLVADSLTESKSNPATRISEVFAYTFATPNPTTSSNKNRENIFNFCFEDDFVPQLPLTTWGVAENGNKKYGKYGKTFSKVACTLYLENPNFRKDMDEFVKLSYGRDKAKFNINSTKKLIEYINRIWPTTIKNYYGQVPYKVLIPGLPPHWEDRVDISLHKFLRDIVAPAAVNENIVTVNALISQLASPVYGQIASFFIDGKAIRKYINDTHQMFTYYAALINGGFDDLFSGGGGGAFSLGKTNILKIQNATSTLTIPDEAEVQKVKNFVQQGDNLKNLGWNLDDISTWSGLSWSDDTESKIVSIDFSYKNLIGTLDVSNFESLKTLDTSGNMLTRIELNNCSSLVNFDCSWNKIEELNVDGCTSLTELYCNNNKLTSINLNTNSLLTDLYCADNNLATLDLTINSLLKSLSCENNYFDLQSGSAMLNVIQTVEARANSWTSYNPQRMPESPIFNSDDISKLQTFASQNDNTRKLQWDLSKPQEWYSVEWVKVGNEYRVKRITIDKLQLTGNLDLSNMLYLEYLTCDFNEITEINLSSCAALRYLSCYNSSVKTLNVLCQHFL